MEERRININRIIESLKQSGLFIKAVPMEPADSTVVNSVTYNSKEASEGTAFICKGAHFKEEYLKSAADYIKKNRGSVENFVNNALGIGCDITEQFRKEFLM